MLRENLEQVKLYSQELIKYQYVDNIKVVDPSGRVIFSTDMKDQNVITEWSNIQKLAVMQQNNKTIIASPILGNDMILGAVVIEYKN
jgi:sensor domain CHASE-containing protein